MMKNFNSIKATVFMLLTTLVFLSSCSKDDPIYSIVGKWSFEETDLEIYINDIDFVSYLVDEMGAPENLVQEYYNEMKNEFEVEGMGDIEFKEDGTFIASSSEYEDSDIGKWSVNSDNTLLTLNYDEEVAQFVIKKLTETELHIAMSESEKQDFNGDGKLDTMTVEMVFLLEK